VVLDSSVTGIADADAERYEFFMLLRKSAVLQSVGFQCLQFAESANAAAAHCEVVLLPGPSDLADILKHNALLLVVRKQVCTLCPE